MLRKARGIQTLYEEDSVSCFRAYKEGRGVYTLMVRPKRNFVLNELFKEGSVLRSIVSESSNVVLDDSTMMVHEQSQVQHQLIDRFKEEMTKLYSDVGQSEDELPSELIIQRNSKLEFQTVYNLVKNPKYLFKIQQVDENINIRDDEKAFKHLCDAIKIAPSCPFGYFRKCVFYWVNRSSIGIIRTVREAFHYCSQTMNEFWFHVLKGILNYAHGNINTLRFHFYKGLMCFEECCESIFIPLVWMGNSLLEVNSISLEPIQQAAKIFRTGFNIATTTLFFDNELATLINNLGRALIFFSESEALDILNNGIAKFPNYMLLYRNRGEVNKRLLKHEGAIKDWEKCAHVNMNPSCKAEIMCDYAELYYIIENWKRSLDIYQQTKEISPNTSALFLFSTVRTELFTKLPGQTNYERELHNAITYSPSYRTHLIARLAMLEQDLPQLKRIKKGMFNRIS